MKRRAVRRTRHVCKSCNQRWARFRYRGEVRWDAKHTLCFQCWRSWMDRNRQSLLVAD